MDPSSFVYVLCAKKIQTQVRLFVRFVSDLILSFYFLFFFLNKQKRKMQNQNLFSRFVNFFFFSLDQENTIFKLNQLPATLRNIPNAVLFFSFLYN